MRSGLHHSPLILMGLLILVLTGCVSAQQRVRNAMQEAPPLPANYETAKQLQAAIAEGRHKMLGPDDVFQYQDQVEIRANLQYAQAGDYPLLLNLFLPKDPLSDPVPAVIYIHGGGWELKGKDFDTYWCMRYASKGYVTATIEYRTSDEAKFPAAVTDAKAAVRWMRAHAEEFGVNPEAIAVVGQSAGAHLALMVGYTPENELLAGDLEKQRFNSQVQAVVALYPPTDLTEPELYEKKIVEKFLGKTYAEAPELYELASPMSHVTPDDPPTLLFHGTIDGIVPVEQSDKLAKMLEQTGVPVIYDRMTGWDHAMDVFQEVNERVMYIQDAFFEAYIPLP